MNIFQEVQEESKKMNFDGWKVSDLADLFHPVRPESGNHPKNQSRLTSIFPSDTDATRRQVHDGRLMTAWAPMSGDFDLLSTFKGNVKVDDDSERKKQRVRTHSLTGSPIHSDPPSPEVDRFSRSSEDTWSQVVRGAPKHSTRNATFKKKKSMKTFAETRKTFTVTLPNCCDAPQVKIVCTCCGDETTVNQIGEIKEQLRPRMIPVATSQLGFCRFCQVNGESAESFQGHNLRGDNGKVTCPVLREYNCPICNNGGGDYAHTVKYCPVARQVRPQK